MSYQVLARKWRPKTFREMVGQEHVLKALINALDHNRLHHAYLFTGTRGVGKTTIARILAKCFNCEAGVSSEPCGVCSACTEIAEGRFIDLIEVDAASRTKVEDTRELLDNVQYAPTRGRYKVYLIDEVHMLSTHSFNALLKTLEEPPPHIKFLLATTDPQKLPATILSRCLQFNLKNMTPERVVHHLQHVLGQEMIAFEEPALWLLGRSADGSMRDALSLTDQAIAFGQGRVGEAEVRAMLGSIDQGVVYELLAALLAGDGAALLAAVARVAEQATDFAGVLEEMLVALHRIAIAHAVPDGLDNSRGDRERILDLAAQLAAEDAQLFYQIALNGRRDLPLSVDPRSGLEMTLLRMLAFKPQGVPQPPRAVLPGATETEPVSVKKSEAPRAAPIVAPAVAPAATIPVAPAVPEPAAPVAAQSAAVPAAVPPIDEPAPPAPRPIAEPVAAPRESAPAPVPAPAIAALPAAVPAAPPPAAAVALEPLQLRTFDNAVWTARFAEFGIGGVIGTIAAHCCLMPPADGATGNGGVLQFILDRGHASFFDGAHTQRIVELLGRAFGEPVQAVIEVGEPSLETPAAYRERQRLLRLAAARQALVEDPNVRLLQDTFGAVLEDGSIEPLDE
jgi:DNA polymerase-3 subunit gamma/tau